MSTQIPRPPRATIRFRLPVGLRKTVLLIHIISGVGWLGVDIVMGVLIFTALPTDDSYLKIISYGALSRAIFWPLIILAWLSLLSGLLLGWSSKFGVLRYTWVLLKLILNLLLGSLVIIALNPTLITAGELSRQLFAGAAVDESAVQDLLYPPIVSTTLLIFASYLAVFKPWGRIRRDRSGRDRRSAAGT